ncbi:unnamed protein product, partial [Mesorhabditis belari]|uniref:C-type lectin domain-containing protein n=1 Tax=Mesorhabditis belari TaxID=2138241 RepID=A0AAF3EN76_9BILA
MGLEQFELLPQSPSKTLTPKPYNTKGLLFGIFIGIFLGIIGSLLVEKSFNSTPFHRPLSRKARNLPASQDEEKQAVDLLKICRANEAKLTLLIDSKNSDKKSSACPVPQSFEGKCRLGSAYLKETDSCYFYHESTYNDEGQLNKYKWETAEKDCTRSGAHLASIHSNVEQEFMKKMISSSFRKNNPKATSKNGCNGSDFYVWFGLRRVDGKRTYSDGTPDDYVGTEVPSMTGNLYYSMCYESTNINQTSIYYYQPENNRGMARYICQKPANK